MTDDERQNAAAPASAASAGPEGDLGKQSLAEFKAAQLKRAKDNVQAMREAQSKEASERRRAVGRAKRNSNGDRTDWDAPATFGQGIAELLAARGWDGELAVARVLAEWPQTVGPDVSANSTPVSLTNGTLTLKAESTAWATQLRLLNRELLEKIAERFGDGVVTSIVARGPSGPPRQTGGWRSPDSRGPRDTWG